MPGMPGWRPSQAPVPPAQQRGSSAAKIVALIALGAVCCLGAAVFNAPPTAAPAASAPVAQPPMPAPVAVAAAAPVPARFPVTPTGRTELAGWLQSRLAPRWPVAAVGPENNWLQVVNPRDCDHLWLSQYLDANGARGELLAVGFNAATCTSRAGTAVVSLDGTRDSYTAQMTGCDRFIVNNPNNSVENRSSYLFGVERALRRVDRQGTVSVGAGAMLRFGGMSSCASERLSRVLDNEREGNSLRAMCSTFGFVEIRCSSPHGEARWVLNDICRCPTSNPEDCTCGL